MPIALNPFAAVEALLDAALPGDTPRPLVSVAIGSAGSVELDLNGEETPIFRVLALAQIAAALGDDEGPQRVEGFRYACGEYADTGVFFLVRTPITAEQQAELEEFGRRIVDEAGK